MRKQWTLFPCHWPLRSLHSARSGQLLARAPVPAARRMPTAGRSIGGPVDWPRFPANQPTRCSLLPELTQSQHLDSSRVTSSSLLFNRMQAHSSLQRRQQEHARQCDWRRQPKALFQFVFAFVFVYLYLSLCFYFSKSLPISICVWALSSL